MGRDDVGPLHHIGVEFTDIDVARPEVEGRQDVAAPTAPDHEGLSDRGLDLVLAEFSGRPYRHPRVTLRLGDARTTLAQIDKRYDFWFRCR